MLNKLTRRYLTIVLLIALFWGGRFSTDIINAMAQTTDILVDVNGSTVSLEAEPFIINDYAMLPLRDTFKIFGCDRFAWDENNKTVTAISGELIIKIKVGDKTAQIGGFNEELDQSAMLKNGRVYLPIRFMSNTFDSYIKYANRKINIVLPFLYKDSQWYAASTSLSNNRLGDRDPNKKELVKDNNKGVKKIGDTLYYQLYLPGSPIGSYHLYQLNNNGKFKYVLDMEETVHDYKIDKNILYYQYIGSQLNPSLSIITKANLAEEPIEKQDIGQKNFSYGSKITLQKDAHVNDVTYISEGNNWEIKPEGLYAIGYNKNAIVEHLVKDLTLLEETYGYYLIDIETNEHKMVRKLDLEYN
ncbi:copper amine oxidase N-terminal domain-containing protein [Dehalobacterium formicoaceticum]|uniref:Copper amine oxidase N-terminal domain-containing protein n=1 Tax=Dehalobacterium formicoaceticum TaxID=51515 RepID=A0ABT1Y3R9_9FIRM|nr:copper amine oxidase N-terminal domain-containing protein [Dehalobacterium formicoaceticum]MCR6545518.1 copper amine oxidase N-terminal domain-containing protein [Dehalobacterium formicoaceticum]